LTEEKKGGVERMETGLEGFDDMIGGGIPKRGVTVAVGSPVSFRPVFVRHLVWHMSVEMGYKVVYVATVSPPVDMLKSGLDHGFDVIGAYEEGNLIIVDAFTPRFGTYNVQIGHPLHGATPNSLGRVPTQHDAEVFVVELLEPLFEREELEAAALALKNTSFNEAVPTVVGFVERPTPVVEEVADVEVEFQTHESAGGVVNTAVLRKGVPEYLPRYRVPVTLGSDGKLVFHVDRMYDVEEGEVLEVDTAYDFELNAPAHVAEALSGPKPEVPRGEKEPEREVESVEKALDELIEELEEEIKRLKRMG